MTDCVARPLPGHDHGGDVREYFRICPAGHLRRGHACAACARNLAIDCAQCGTEKPAILIPAETWIRLMTEAWELITADLLSRTGARELVAEGAGPLLDPDCVAGKCGSCVGAPCEHECHRPGPR